VPSVSHARPRQPSLAAARAAFRADRERASKRIGSDQQRRLLILLLATCETVLDKLRTNGDTGRELIRDLERVVERARAELSSPS